MPAGQPHALDTFRALHAGPEVLKLPNAWDGASARLFESLGAKAIATTSAGVAWAHGYPDGDALPVRLLLASVADMARVVAIPLSVDIESGYSDDLDEAARVAVAVIEAGGAGINIEDGAGSPDLLCAKIAAIRAAAKARGADLFINARIDVYLRGLAPPERAVEESIARARRYAKAGADGAFVPGTVDAAEIKTLAEGVGLPLNVLARPGLPDAAELQRLGVRRLSAGSGICQALMGQAGALAADFLTNGRSGPLAEGAMAYGDINALFNAG
ncbi:MAG: isocitrate lyase/PEP mutase family protein [Caulobacteraceae bacterium]